MLAFNLLCHCNSQTLNSTFCFLFPILGHSHPMDMPGRGLYDERDSGIARSGRLIRLRSEAQIDLHRCSFHSFASYAWLFLGGLFKAKDTMRIYIFLRLFAFSPQISTCVSLVLWWKKKKAQDDLLKLEGSRSSEWSVTQLPVTLTVAASAAVIGMYWLI